MSAHDVTAPRVTEQRAGEIFESTKRWGRWGPDDERGALNLLTTERVTRAASLVRTGELVPCGREFPVTPAPDNPFPAQHHMVIAGDVLNDHDDQACADYVGVFFHGMSVSHLDALCHWSIKRQIYNGYPASSVTSRGAQRNSLVAAFDGIVGRGVLLDIPRTLGIDWLNPGEAMGVDTLDAACADQDVTIEPGDILLVSTGRDARRSVHGAWDPDTVGLAGLHPECATWLLERDIAVLGCDGVSDPLPKNTHDFPFPLHVCCLVGMGVYMLDNLRLDRLARSCEAAGRWEFMFAVSPLQIVGGTGSPVNPVAIL